MDVLEEGGGGGWGGYFDGGCGLFSGGGDGLVRSLWVDWLIVGCIWMYWWRIEVIVCVWCEWVIDDYKFMNWGVVYGECIMMKCW